MRAQAELFYDQSQSYSGLCTNAQFKAMLDQASTTGGSGACFADANGWSASAALKGAGGYWCVGNSGASKATTSQVTATSSCQ
jgi:hypothetical protein